MSASRGLKASGVFIFGNGMPQIADRTANAQAGIEVECVTGEEGFRALEP